MKYKVGDKTLLGEIVKANELDEVLKYKVQIDREFVPLWLNESDIDAIIIKPKRNIDHFIELWESGQTNEAIVFFNETRDLGFRTDRTNGKIVGICTALFQPYTEPSRYPKLTPDELKAVKWLVDGGFEHIVRKNGSTRVHMRCDDGASMLVALYSITFPLVGSSWITESPINLAELLAAQED